MKTEGTAYTGSFVLRNVRIAAADGGRRHSNGTTNATSRFSSLPSSPSATTTEEATFSCSARAASTAPSTTE